MSTRAVVIGGSIGGLICARVLSDHFDEVLVLDRDTRPETPEARKGVPQGRHVHCLLAGGSNAIGVLFPGIFENLKAQGAKSTDMAQDVAWFNAGTWRLQYPSGIEIFVQSRPLLEQEIRRRVGEIANVTQRFETAVEGLSFDAEKTNVSGVLLANGQTILADLVVDSSGRGTKTPEWLQDAGFPAVPVSKVTIDVGYATQFFRAQPGRAWPWQTLLVQAKPPHGTRYGAIFRIENDVLQATLVGQFRDYPPNDNEGFLRFAETLDHPALAEALAHAEPVSPIFAFRFPANSWRRYDKLDRFPGKFLVFGDAICSVNPVYGQGMTIAALEALGLRECLSRKGGMGQDLARRFFPHAVKAAGAAWALATGGDLAFPRAQGDRPPGQGVLLWYVRHVLALASHNEVALAHWIRVTNLQRPLTHLFAPPLLGRVLTRALLGGRPLPVKEPIRHFAAE